MFSTTGAASLSKVRLTPAHLSRMNIGRRFWRAEVRDFDGSFGVFLRHYVEDLCKNRSEGWGLFLWGANGRGKTHAACAILKEFARRRFTTYTVMAETLARATIEKTRFDERETVMERCLSVDVLLIEDIGKEFSGKSGFYETTLENLLRNRTRDLKVTLATSNATPAEFKERYGVSVASMVMESMIPYNVKGVDRRQEKAQKVIDKHRKISYA